MTESITNEPAFDRLLQVAVEVFAEYGFREATVREICSRANLNVASVNYYFRSKEALYSQALTFAFQEANRLYPQDTALKMNLPPVEFSIISLMICNIQTPGTTGCSGKWPLNIS